MKPRRTRKPRRYPAKAPSAPDLKRTWAQWGMALKAQELGDARAYLEHMAGERPPAKERK